MLVRLIYAHIDDGCNLLSLRRPEDLIDIHITNIDHLLG